ncbi:MAG: hypothetical protein QOG80_48, partial [Pseudonocardiales bacterium]|nr:hypothetical protein [Pseudonocardiales bacterium]
PLSTLTVTGVPGLTPLSLVGV